jgi:hypothetical protein
MRPKQAQKHFSQVEKGTERVSRRSRDRVRGRNNSGVGDEGNGGGFFGGKARGAHEKHNDA